MTKKEITLICFLDHPFTHSPHQGIVNALFEKVDNTYIPIGSGEYNCPTNQVFILNGYDSLESKHTNEIFELKVQETNREVKDGDCQFVSAPEHSSALRSKMICAEIVEHSIPNANDMIIVLDQPPVAKTLFLKGDGELYGPFSCDVVDEADASTSLYECHLSTFTQDIRSADNSKLLTPYHYATLDEALIQNKLHTMSTRMVHTRHFIGDIKQTLNDAESFTDYIGDDEIINKYAGMLAANPAIRNFTKGHRDLIKNQVKSIKQFRQHKNRFERLFDLFDLTDEWSGNRTALMEEFIKSSEGQSILKSYIDENKDDYFKEERERFNESLLNEFNQLSDGIVQLKQQKHDIESEIRAEKEKLKNVENEDFQEKELTKKARESIDASLSEKHQELQALSDSLSELKEKYKQYDTVDKLELQISDLKAVCKYEQKNLDSLKGQKVAIQEEIKDENDELLGKLVSLKPKVDMLSGIMPSEPKQQISFITPANYTVSGYDTSSQQEFIESVYENLASYGRKVDFDDLANVIISLSQNQFTLFSGLPGTGKTSLAKLIGSSIGLENRLLNIPVARGWTSQRDVLGFYNALSQSYVSSSTGLYDMLNQMQSKDDHRVNTPAIVLLDEFNLSQPEHYFSPFLEMADSESSRIIHTGDPQSPQLDIPLHVRFLGTINNDESVQVLTPRMLDRSAVIHFEDQVDASSAQVVLEGKNGITKPTISGDDFIKLFNGNANSVLPDDIKNILDVIIKTLYNDSPEYGSQVIVSYRKIKAISNYYNTASSLMISDRLTAFDFAVVQHIIPLLNGFGDTFGKRLVELLSQLPEGLERSRARLQRIIIRGELNLHTYGAMA